MSKIRLNRKTTILNDNVDNNVDVKLKFDDDVRYLPNGEEYVLRTWVNKDKFQEFELEYHDSQDDNSPINISDVEFEVHINMKDLDTKIIGIKIIWIPLTEVHGGISGVKMFVRHKIIEMIYIYENSNREILSMNLIKLYIGKQKQHETHFKDIKMYGTLFNYNGFGLDAIKGEIANACVPEYLHKLYNNPDETNPRKRLSKLTMDKILKELNMNTIDEGCSITQIANFCNIHKITYYVLNYKYKLFETNNNVGYHSNLQRLVFMCANNHLYPIDDNEKR